jgi:hypothetical protein
VGQYLFNCSSVGAPTYPQLVGMVNGDTTAYIERDRQVGPLGVWRTRFVPFDPASWERVSGTASFAEVLHDVDKLYMNMDCNSTCNDEAGIDNIGLGGPPPGPPDPAQCTVEPWDSRHQAFVTPGDQSLVDVLSVTIRDAHGGQLDAIPVEIHFESCGVCLDAGDAGLRGTTGPDGRWAQPAGGRVQQCTVR